MPAPRLRPTHPFGRAATGRRGLGSAPASKWMTVRDKYTVDYLSSWDAGLVMAVVWAIDRWVERD